MRKLVIAPTYTSAEYWGGIYGYDTRRVDVVVMTRSENLREFNALKTQFRYEDTLIVYGDDFGSPENVLNTEQYHSFKELLRYVEKELYER